MNPFARVRRAGWLPGAILLTSVAIAVTFMGVLAGLRAWWAYLGLILGLLLAAGALERLWMGRRSAKPAPPRSKLRVIPGGKAGYDLTKDDDSTHKQRWLM